MTDGLEGIIEEIKGQAEEERDSILEAAERKAEEIKSGSEKKAEQERNKIIEKGKRESETIKKRILASARKDSRQKKLETREEMIQEVIKRTKEKLDALKEDGNYKEVLINLIESGGETVGGGKLKVLISRKDDGILSKQDIEEISKKITEETGEETSIQITDELPNSKGGAIVEKKDGSVSCNNTFESRLERMENTLRTEIAEILFQ
ncbi:MAG: V-type ATP synthase subunit E [Candidatus Hadarchaeia archaeon]